MNTDGTAEEQIAINEATRAATREVEREPRKCGPIIEKRDGYYKERGGTQTQISNFTIVPTQIITLERGDETIKVDFVLANERETVFLEKADWNSKRSFLTKIPNRKYWFAGTEQDIQYLKGIVGHVAAPVSQGTRLVGLVEHNGENIYVLSSGSIGMTSTSIRFMPPPEGNPIAGHLPGRGLRENSTFIAHLFPTIFSLHEKMPLLCAIGWFFATPFKPLIMKRVHHFPILSVYGTKGSGKTTLIALLWRIFGFSGELFSCAMSGFSWIKILSSTNCLPVCFDEFKPYDMKASQVREIQQFMRKAYNGAIETRGKADQSIMEYPLIAPVVILGENTFQDLAILERIVPVSLSYQEVLDEHKQAYKKLDPLPLRNFLPVYLKWCLRQNTANLWEYSRKVVDAECETFRFNISERIRDNITTVVFGLSAANKFATEHGLVGVSFSLHFLMEYLLGEVTEGMQARIALDVLLEKLSDMAERGGLKREIDFSTRGEVIFLRFNQCIDAFKRWAKSYQYSGEILDYKAYRKMLKERGSYVSSDRTVQRFNGKPVMCVAINAEKAAKVGLELTGFKEEMLDAQEPG